MSQAFVGVGTNGLFSLVVGLHAPVFSGPGVYLNPIGVNNAASFQPITASISPGEDIALYGTGLSSTTTNVQGGQVFPTTSLGGVSVTIDGIPCPLYSVSSTQLNVVVPYEVASNTSGLANIQVTNNGVPSNVVQMYLTDALPGVFSQTQNGIGLAAALHNATGLLVTPDNPAQPGEYIQLYMTGLGTVTPAIPDGAVGPSATLSYSDLFNAGFLAVLFNDYIEGSTENAGNYPVRGPCADPRGPVSDQRAGSLQRAGGRRQRLHRDRNRRRRHRPDPDSLWLRVLRQAGRDGAHPGEAVAPRKPSDSSTERRTSGGCVESVVQREL